MALPFLEILGLTKKEADLYEILLSRGEMPIGALIKISGLKRATVYKSLYSLEARGLVAKHDMHKKLHVKPESPTLLTALAQQQIQTVERAAQDLRTLLPHLTQAYITTVEKPVVTVYESVEGLKRIYEDTLTQRATIYSALSTKDVEPELFRWVTKVYTRKRTKLKIPVKVIVASGGWAEEYVRRNTRELRETVLVPANDYPFQHEMLVYADKVAFIDFKKGGSLIGIIIHHQAIAETVQALWQRAWDSAQITQPT